MKLRGWVLIPFLLVVLFGCHALRGASLAPPPEPAVRPAPVLPEALLDERIEFLNKMLQEKNLGEQSEKMASRLLETYEAVKAESRQGLSEAECRTLVEELFQGLGLVDENYFAHLQQGTAGSTELATLLASRRSAIMDAYLIGNYKGAINQCLELKKQFGPDALTREIKLVFTLSLAREGMTEEAINLGGDILQESKGSPDLFDLRLFLARWLLQSGEKERAHRIYEKLTDVLGEREAAVQGLGKEVGTASEPAAGGETLPQQPPEQTTPEAARGPLASLLERGHELTKEERFGEARELLSRAKDQVESPSEKEAIDQALLNLDSAEDRFLSEKIASLSRRKDSLESARQLLEEEKFEEAISQLESLEKEHLAGRESEVLKERAIEQLINRERNRAAKFFLAAKQTQDTSKKEAYLRESYGILKNLLDKYPSSPLIDKVKSNLAIVTEEIEKLGKPKQQG
jgi:hypothetical protein